MRYSVFIRRLSKTKLTEKQWPEATPYQNGSPGMHCHKQVAMRLSAERNMLVDQAWHNYNGCQGLA